MKIYVAGIGPGSPEDITPAVLEAVRDSDVIVGYKYYFQFITPYLKPGTECIDTGMKKERDRAEEAFRLAESGKTVCVISSGDAGIYGMTPLIYEMKKERGTEGKASGTVAGKPEADASGTVNGKSIEIVPLPGISAFQKAASLLGAPMGHDFCVISMSDLMTPWRVIEKRIKAAARGDFVTAVYNPKSKGRYWQLHRLKEIFMQERKADTTVGYVRQAGRADQEVKITTLAEFDPEDVDMFTIVIIGNSQSYQWNGKFITPRGYYRQQADEGKNVGQSIMIKSFQTIRKELKNPDVEIWKLWPMLHAIHTTADFDMENLLWMDEKATETLYNKVASGQIKTIVTDVSMVASGIRKGALERLGIEVHSYISDPRGAEMAKAHNITRAQAGIRLALEDYPEGKGVLFAFGNAPTALLELCELIRKGKCKPEGIVGAPVGFVHVEESKHAAKPFTDIPKILIEGRKGGSNLAATLVNSILTFDDAVGLRPGRDV
ncbi:MAG: precorrin-3B C(17)-methyltransferase [Bacteroidaceae bacterium]|nr:precorrin-3B C(17)-methyltransferase [Bacteroidaceae bacterium]